MGDLPDFKPLNMLAPDLEIEHRPDGSILLSQHHPLPSAPKTIAHLFQERAKALGDRPYLCQREPGHGPWRCISYGDALRQVEGIAQWLLDQGLTADDSIMILSSNSIEHALFTLAGHTAGIPVAPISPAYSLVSTDHEKLRHTASMVSPKVVFAQNGEPFARAFATLKTINPDLVFVTTDGAEGSLTYDELAGTEPTTDVAAARDGTGYDTVAKYLFTSGSTGMPKCVPQTQRMFCTQISFFRAVHDPQEVNLDETQEFLEWMPWSHISGGNLNFNKIIYEGATMYIDEGKPAPGMFDATIKNLYEVSPRFFGSAPIAFGMLASAMEEDPVLRKSFFRNLEYMIYGGAALSSDVSERIQKLAVEETGQRVPLLSMFGSTEVQGATLVHWHTERTGLLGLPLPGLTLKLAPVGDKLEVRLKGDTVAPGYHKDPEKTAAAFDEEGFYRLGDAAKLADPERPEEGLVFDGRVTEDFKLNTGTWVSVGTLRPDVIAATSPLVYDAVICGQDEAFVGALFWPAPAGVALAKKEGPVALVKAIAGKLMAFNALPGGSSRRIKRFSVLTTPPSLDVGEITDKGYINQRAAQAHRASEVQALFAETPPPTVIVL